MKFKRVLIVLNEIKSSFSIGVGYFHEGLERCLRLKMEEGGKKLF